MMTAPIRMLHLEDDPLDAELIRQKLIKFPRRHSRSNRDRFLPHRSCKNLLSVNFTEQIPSMVFKQHVYLQYMVFML